MSDVRNKYGDVVYIIEGDRINDVYGNWKFTIVGDRINDTYGNWKYQVRGDYIFDTNGNRLGEKKNLAEILGPPSNPSNTSSGVDIEPVRKELPDGWWGCLLSLLLLFLKLNWGGKIGVILGIIITIAIAISESGDMPGGNVVITGVIITVVLGIIGTIIGAATLDKGVATSDKGAATSDKGVATSDKWVWLYSITPILGMILNLAGVGVHVVSICFSWAIMILLLALDVRELKKRKFNLGVWFWLCYILAPIYLFVRAARTNKKYGYAITYWSLFALSTVVGILRGLV